ncbi:recombinase family protein [Magnetospirillum fulvum]|uniref:Site-specific recombinase and resolvase superfamily protein n=1 Tax=Magnetospirillum fulvum MGU-K5 TaxID=1316936 RepID=S9S8H4_MAGFU|nr:recombinase family protein [Magnetospirillum fulvum]EPY00979.1 site-specific recombinase and resolvase superfamily protein [Magnetospirillum fulvum MGU-K5]
MVSVSPYRIAIYARYSSDLQNPSSVDDQISLCRRLIAGQLATDPDHALIFSDAAMSGATIDRPGLTRLLEAVRSKWVDLVVAEGLDRLSRSLKDIAAIHETMSYNGVTIWTAHEGRITELHIGLKGTMNSLFLSDMKARIKRGHRARIVAGYAISACPYGYRIVRGVVDDKRRNVNGVREIEEEAAQIIRRIYQEFADGRNVSQIVDGLNRDGIPAPSGRTWMRHTLVGSPRKQEGILRNPIYIGQLVFNRSYVVRDPVTNKRVSVPNPEAEWTKVDVPHLRIISDELWAAVRENYRGRLKKKDEPEPEPRILNSHNQHALTGWIKCGWCGGGKQIANDSRYLCSTHRYAKKCKNSRGTREPVLMAATFDALYTRIKHGPAFRPHLIQAFASELERSKELSKVEADLLARIGRLLDAIEHGIDTESATQRVLDLQDQLKHARQTIQIEAPPILPDEATIRATLARAVQSVEMARDVKRTRRMLKCLLSEIVLTPIADNRCGETITLTLREEGWPDFWRMVSSGMARPGQK